MAQIDALIVIYNKPLAESQTVLTLNAPDDVQVWVADNSTEDYDNRAFAESHGFRYVDMGGNMGLSKAYNRVINMLDKDDGLLCLFDDDTTVDGRYFEALKVMAVAHPDIDIFAPVVRDAHGILSPCIIHSAACRRVNSLDELPEHGVSAINSGMAVRRRVFRDYRYDEGQFLDYVDHAFIRDVTGNERGRIHIIKDVTLRQAFSGSEKQSREAAVQRYRIFRKDIGYFCRKYGISSLKKNVLLLKRRLRIALNQ